MSKVLELLAPELQSELAAAKQPDSAQNEPPADEEELVLTARRKITLRCGRSSITLHANGKIVLRGEYILSEAEGTNRIAGGRVDVN